MPLVVPGVNNNSGDKTSEWSQKLIGKKLGDSADSTTFDKKQLPKDHRVLSPGSMSTMDHKPDRLNVHLDESGNVNKVTHG